MPIDLAYIGRKLEPVTHTYAERDVMLYALGVGCGPDELKFLYERDLEVLPTFAVIPSFPAMLNLGGAMQVNPALVLHGEQRIDLRAPIPTSGTITTTPTIKAVHDKGKGAVVVVETESVDARGRVLFVNTASIFARGEGGFGGERGPSGPRNVPPDRPPDRSVSMKTLPQQALLYRLSGDMNPLHADPDFAKLGGYDRPILHGLCTFGHAGRAVLRAFCGNDPARLKTFEVRFSGVVFPGETITTDMWQVAPGQIVLTAKTERGEAVLTAAAAEDPLLRDGRLLAMAVVALVVAGCPRRVPPVPEPAEPPLAERTLPPSGEAHFEVDRLDWSRSEDGRELYVEGLVKNTGSRATRDVKVWVDGVDANGVRIARAEAYPSPQAISPGSAGRFVVRLPNDAAIRSFKVEVIGR